MLTTLFKVRNPLASGRADKRLGAIEALTPDKAEKLRDELAERARADTDVRVRRAALARVGEHRLLEELLDDAEVVEAAAQRLAALGASTDHPAVRKARMRAAESVEAALDAASGITKPDELTALFLSCPERHREALLPKVRLLGDRGLAALERQSRNRDKEANRTARAEQEALRDSNRTVQALCERAEELKTALARKTTGTNRARTDQLRRTLEECVLGVRGQAQTLARYGLEIPNLDDWQAAIDAAIEADEAPQAAVPGFAALAADFQALDQRMAAGEPLASLKQTHDDLADNWLAQADRAQPDKAQKTLFETVNHRYLELIEADERRRNIDFREVDVPTETLDWPEDPEALQALWKQQHDLERTAASLGRQLDSVGWPPWAAMPEALRAVADSIARIDQFRSALADHQRTLEGDLAALIDKTGASVAEGHLKPAQSSLGQARKIARSLPERVVRRHRRALLAAAARVEELQDWQAFATSPKRRELLDSIKALAAEAPSNAKDRADRIKALRAEWNALGPIAGSGTRAMQAQFNRYAERAFEPCREHFNEQAELRKNNLAQRRQICEQLEAYLDNVDWASADMRAAEQIMRAARYEWRAHHPVDRRHAKELEARFEALQQRIFVQVRKVWDANLAAKRAIVEACEKLAASEATMADKVREAKALQRQWREVGITPRKPDQQLWRQFREQCDLIFAARESGRKALASQRESAIARAEAICQTMQEAVADANPNTADRATLARLRAELNGIALPDRLEKSVHKRFDDIARNYNQLILAGEIEALCEELDRLKTWDVEVSQAEAEGRALAPPAPVFAERSADDEEPLHVLHCLTLEAELLAGIESPAADRQLRLKVQVDALNQSMGQRTAEKEPRELADAWCRLGPKSDASQALRERFFDALLKLAGRHDR